ncbi:hypothetical protein [Pseudomonas sp. GD03696]|uniref:hypothetical protein n=1 Tax=Pseudomonas sp. GD03696 TaxID=2975368 RepID=UPI002447A6FA|nr:hypothetical protein [Pseudomonas sp. GD03696]MDH1927772.1 hypothetical protein [Pseudomonas sp. GD03696]
MSHLYNPIPLANHVPQGAYSWHVPYDALFVQGEENTEGYKLSPYGLANLIAKYIGNDLYNLTSGFYDMCYIWLISGMTEAEWYAQIDAWFGIEFIKPWEAGYPGIHAKLS